jgi:hypothetical protein
MYEGFPAHAFKIFYFIFFPYNIVFKDGAKHTGGVGISTAHDAGKYWFFKKQKIIGY